MSIVNIEDYRPPEKSGVPCVVTFIGFRFWTPEGEEQRLNVSVHVADGDFAGIIDIAKERGGIWIPAQDGVSTNWFLPWPCAAVRISPEQ
jgi:hypothetical protein